MTSRLKLSLTFTPKSGTGRRRVRGGVEIAKMMMTMAKMMMTMMMMMMTTTMMMMMKRTEWGSNPVYVGWRNESATGAQPIPGVLDVFSAATV